MQFINHDSTHECRHLLYHNFFFPFLFLKSEINELLLPAASPLELGEHVPLAASLTLPGVCRSKPEGLPSLPDL